MAGTLLRASGVTLFKVWDQAVKVPGASYIYRHLKLVTFFPLFKSLISFTTFIKAVILIIDNQPNYYNRTVKKLTVERHGYLNRLGILTVLNVIQPGMFTFISTLFPHLYIRFAFLVFIKSLVQKQQVEMSSLLLAYKVTVVGPILVT